MWLSPGWGARTGVRKYLWDEHKVHEIKGMGSWGWLSQGLGPLPSPGTPIIIVGRGLAMSLVPGQPALGAGGDRGRGDKGTRDLCCPGTAFSAIRLRAIVAWGEEA